MGSHRSIAAALISGLSGLPVRHFRSERPEGDRQPDAARMSGRRNRALDQTTRRYGRAMASDDFLQVLADLSDEEFERLYGPLAHLQPTEAAVLLDGFAAPWWIVGGWAIEAFTGDHRPHDDVDVCVLARDVPVLLDHFLGTHHVWAAGAGMMCPLLRASQRLPSWLNQIWVREDATHPWLLDVIVTPDREGRWVFRRDPTVVEDLERITYQRPEITLAFKAGLDRPKDTVDLEAALPRLDPAAMRWLRSTIARLHPGHPWIQRLQ